ncbi:MAG TPA: hypothetical protein VKN14_04995 [Flavobacteriaceae bacterium]|nr:hypothetical protein [Flavobacteriaceae bacterium]
MRKSIVITLFFALMMVVGCTANDVEPVDSSLKEDLTAQAKRFSSTIWADCEAFGTLGTKSSFKASAGNFDELYNGAHFKDGLGAISESKQGDKDFNGGRWHVNTLKEGVDPNKYWSACSVEDLYSIDNEFWNDFESTSTYFECPLIPLNN